jgi:flagellar basal-body rod modification protein FlgD
VITSTSIIDQMNAMASTSRATPSSEVSKTAFLELMVKQLQNQDPMSPADSDQFMTQMAQFSSLEQQINLNELFESFLGFQALTQASSMIGKEVQAIAFNDDSTSEIVEGKVEEVILLNGNPILKLSSGDEVSIQAVVKVSDDS